jgi:small-conductance mechanosensitive channel
MGWLALALLRAFSEIVVRKSDLTAPDNLAARRRHTRIGILSRIGSLVILFLTICMMLMTIPGVRTIGVTLMASAGLAGLAIGAAAQPALKNLIAGIQMAFTEPIRIDDVVIISGEWGRVEEIRLTYVVLKLWDERRLVVPISEFLEKPFQNWTRTTSALLGTVLWRFDFAADVARLRSKLEEIVRANPRWDGRFFNMQVTDVSDETIEVRALVTASNADKAFDLRCDVREAILEFVRLEMPEALPRHRQLQLGAASRSPVTGSPSF